MKALKYKISLAVLVGVSLLVVADQIEASREYSFEELSGFLAMCGNLIQTGFGKGRPDVSDYFIVLVSCIVVIYTLGYSIKYLIRPAENEDHIKYKILDDEKEG